VTASPPGGQVPSQTKGGEAQAGAPASGVEKKVVSVTHPGAGSALPQATHPVVAAPPHGSGISGAPSPVSAPTPQEGKHAGGTGGDGFRQGRPAQLGSQTQVGFEVLSFASFCFLGQNRLDYPFVWLLISFRLF
jgi:hypothetical protein